MAGYRLIEVRMLKPNNRDGIEPHPNRIGFLDFLRELREETFPFERGKKIRIEGIEDVLLAATADERDQVAQRIHSILKSKANELESQLATDIQVIFRYALQLSDDFWIKAGSGSRNHLSLRKIFG